MAASAEPRLDAERELGEARLTRTHIAFAALVGAALFLDGYDLFNGCCQSNGNLSLRGAGRTARGFG